MVNQYPWSLSNDYIAHHGVLGMKWGVRRYQNEDGSLTDEGRRRYTNSDGSLNDEGKKFIRKQYDKSSAKGLTKFSYNAAVLKSWNEAAKKMNNGEGEKYSKEYKETHKDNFNNDEYEKGYNERFSELLEENFNKLLADFYTNDADIQYCIKLTKDYKMTDWDTKAKNNYNAMMSVLEPDSKEAKEYWAYYDQQTK